MKTLLLTALLFAQRPTPPALQTGTVTGRLLNEDGSPAVKIRVSAMSIAENRNGGNESPSLITLTESDETGRYRLAEVPVGRYYIVAGFVDSPTYYPRGTTPAGATPINVSLNATVANIDFRIEKPSVGLTVSGRVFFETNAQPSMSNVMMSGGPGGAGFTNINVPLKLDGSFEFLRVRPGTYSISIPAPFSQPLNVTVVDRAVTGLELRVPWTGEITGRVVVEDQGPLPPVNLNFIGAGRQTNAYAASANSAFRVSLPEGSFAVTAANLPSGFYLKSVTAGSADLLVDPLRLKRTEMPPEIVVTLGISTPSPWVKLSGRIIGSRPAGAFSLSLSGQGGTVQSNVSADGSFEFAKILPGSYTAFLPSAGGSNQVTIVVPNKDLNGVELSLPLAKEIKGQISVEGGGPLPRVTFALTGVPEVPRPGSLNSSPSLAQLLVTNSSVSRVPSTLFATIEQDGTFKVNLPEGRYPIAANIQTNGAAQPYSVKSFSYGAIDLMKDPINVVAAETAEMQLTFAARSPNPFAKVRGRVLGLPAAEAVRGHTTVSLNNPAFYRDLTVEVQPDGSFEFPKVYSGTYQARLSGVAANVGVAPVEVNVAGTDVTNVEINLPRQREVSGRIILEGRGAMPRLSIPLTAVSSASGVSQGQVTSINIQPQPDGTFKVMIPEGARQIGRPNSTLPRGYALKSIQYGSTDLATSPLNVGAQAAELRVTLTTPDLPAVKVRGRVAGVNESTLVHGQTLINLWDPSLASAIEAIVLPDGSFEFPSVFAGNYTARLSGIILRVTAPTLNVAVRDRDVTGLEFVLPREHEIVGRVILEGRNSMPWFGIPLLPLVTPPNSDGSLIVNMNILPDSNGTFRVTVPEGERRVGNPSGLAPGYAVKAITYGPVDLLKTPMKVSIDDKSQLIVTVTAPSQSPVLVSGKVTGVDPAILSRGGVTLGINAQGYVGLRTFVSADGSFTFPEVFPGKYEAHVGGEEVVSFRPHSFQVGDRDLRDVQIALPAQKEVTGRVVVEGASPIPRFSFSPAQSSEFTQLTPFGVQPVNVQPESDGRFRITLVEGEGPFRKPDLPEGFILKAATYGSTDLLRAPLKVRMTDSAELVLTLSGPSSRPVSVSGRLEELDPAVRAAGPARVLLMSLTFGGSRIARINPDGSFEARGVFPGKYLAQFLNTIDHYSPLDPSASTPPGGTKPDVTLGVPGAPSLITKDIAVEVKDSDIKDLKLPVSPVAKVSGRIVIQGGGPIPRLQLRLMGPSAEGHWLIFNTFSLIPDADGRFNLILPEGNRSLNVDRLPSGYTLRSMTYGPTDLQRAELRIRPTEPTEELRIILEKSAAPPLVTVSGRATGLREPGKVRVRLDGAFNLPREIPLNSDGTFVFTQVFPGRNSIRLVGDVESETSPAVSFTAGTKDIVDLEIMIRQ